MGIPKESGEIEINIAFFLFLLQLLLFYFPSQWPLIPLQNPSSWEFWRIPQIALHTIPSGFQKDPIMCPPGIPSDLCYPRAADFLAHGSGAIVSKAEPGMEGAICGSRTGTKTFNQIYGQTLRLHYINRQLQCLWCAYSLADLLTNRLREKK